MRIGVRSLAAATGTSAVYVRAPVRQPSAVSKLLYAPGHWQDPRWVATLGEDHGT